MENTSTCFETFRRRKLSLRRRWQITELALFGSAVREDFGPDSDVDLLVQLRPQARCMLFDIGRMQEELTLIFGGEVDLVERTAVEQSRNCIRRQAILQSAEVIHAT